MTTTTEREETREARVKDAHSRLDAAVLAIKTSADWMAWLKQAARFHKYSASNIFLILSQCPQASQVAGGSTWKKLGRWISSGPGSALWIFAPMLVNWSPAEIAENPERRGGKKFIGFKVVPVFDVSQTDGAPLAEMPGKPEILDGDAPEGMFRNLRMIALRAGFSVEFKPLPGGMNGVTDFSGNSVTINSGMSDAQSFKTLAHEVGHILLHSAPEERQSSCRGEQEVEAESVAFIICDHFRMPSDEYSFGYIAGWSARDKDAVQKTATRVMQAVKKILAVLDPEQEIAA